MAGGETPGTITNSLGYATGLMDEKEWNGTVNPTKKYPQSIPHNSTESFEQLPDTPGNKTSSGALVYTARNNVATEAPLKVMVAWKNSAIGNKKLAYTKIYLPNQAINWDAVKENLEIATSAAGDNVGGVASSIKWKFDGPVPSIAIQLQVAAGSN